MVKLYDIFRNDNNIKWLNFGTVNNYDNCFSVLERVHRVTSFKSTYILLGCISETTETSLIAISFASINDSVSNS